MIDDLYFPTYEITPLTMAVLAQYDENDNPITRILEKQQEHFVRHAPTKIINNACKFFGSSLRGRQDGTRGICGITHKAPIAIDPGSGMYFFPTISPTSSKCSWIAHSYVDSIKEGPGPGNSTGVVFKNGETVFLEVSYGSMLNQLQRTAQYRYLLDNRINYLRKQDADMVAEPYA